MKVYKEYTPFDFLIEDSWECDDLQDKIGPDKVDAFNEHVEEMFPDGCSETELNDYLRFNYDEILDALGIDNDEDDDEDDEDDWEDED